MPGMKNSGRSKEPRLGPDYGPELKRLAKAEFGPLVAFYEAAELEFSRRGWQQGKPGTLGRRFQKAFTGDGAFDQTLQEVFDKLVGLPDEVKKHLGFLSTETSRPVSRMKPSELPERISKPNELIAARNDIFPWVTDEEVLQEYRDVFHCYYQTKQGPDIYWIYSPVDFTKPYNGHLRALVRITVNATFDYKVYGYLFRKMFVMVSKCDEKANKKDAIHVYYDFRNRARDAEGHFGIFMNEDWEHIFGVGGSLFFKKPFPNAESPGRQTPAVCKALSNHWKVLDGERCNRILHLFGRRQYSRPPSDWIKLRNAFSDEFGSA